MTKPDTSRRRQEKKKKRNSHDPSDNNVAGSSRKSENPAQSVNPDQINEYFNAPRRPSPSARLSFFPGRNKLQSDSLIQFHRGNNRPYDSSTFITNQENVVQHKNYKKEVRKYPKSLIKDRVKAKDIVTRVTPGEGSSEDRSPGGSELAVSSYHDVRGHRKSLSSQLTSSTTSSSSMSSSSHTTLGSSIHKFRDDFEDLKCKMKIFGESLNLCKCIASDFKGKLTFMERRLRCLEKRQKSNKAESNYSAIIQKNKELSTKTQQLVHKLQKCGTEEEMREVAGRIVKNYLPGLWKVVEPGDLQFNRISGGLSNFIYVLGLPDDLSPLYARLENADDDTKDEAKSIRSNVETLEEPRKVLLRIYGQVHGERAMDAIVTESVIFTLLSERRLGPKLFGVFSGGRIEEYIHSRSLFTRELADPALSMKIAEKVAAVHSMDIPLSKEATFIWKSMGKWLKTIKEECFVTGLVGKNEAEDRAIKRLKDMNYEHEIDWLKKYLSTIDSPVVFCHNDLQEGNILLLDETQQHTTDEFETSTFVQAAQGTCDSSRKIMDDEISRMSLHVQVAPPIEKEREDAEDRPPSRTQSRVSRVQMTSMARFMQNPHEDEGTSDTVLSHISDSGEPKIFLIDFEYCAYNHRGFDIANHFAEWAYDYTNPVAPFFYETPEYWPTLEQKEIFIKEYLKHYHSNLDENTEINIDAVNKLLGEVEAFSLASHLLWTLWSIVNASKSQIPFGYWEYGLSRLETYLRLKQEVIKKDKFGLPQKRKIEEVDI